jgi:hypothetical protein
MTELALAIRDLTKTLRQILGLLREIKDKK